MSELKRKVTVCDKCLRACCWQGEFMCEEAQNAGTVEITVGGLRKLNRENSGYWREQDGGRAGTMIKCLRCGGYMTPKYYAAKMARLKRRPICAACGFRGFASFFEEEIEGETIKEKSENEQLGAWIRDLANSDDNGGRLNMIGTANIGKRQEQETLYVDFVEKVKKEGMVRASLSHSQTHPCEIHFSAILDWQWDGELFSISVTGNRGVCSGTMPAFHIYEQESDGGRAR